MDEILKAWREGGYQPSPRLLDTVASIERSPLGYWIEIGLGRYRMCSRGPRDAVESSRPRGWTLTGWSIVLGAAMLCEPSRTAGRADTDRVRRVIATFLDSMSGREAAEDGATAPPATSSLIPPAKPLRGRSRVKPAAPPAPPLKVVERPMPAEELEGSDDDEPPSGPGYRH